MSSPRLLLISDHIISSGWIRRKRGELVNGFEIVEASTPFPLELFRSIAEVREASGSEEQMIEALTGVSICVAHHAPFTEMVMKHAPDLKLILVCRGGPAKVNLTAATARGITVAYTLARNAAATAEHTIGTILSPLRGIPAPDAGIRRGE